MMAARARVKPVAEKGRQALAHAVAEELTIIVNCLQQIIVAQPQSPAASIAMTAKTAAIRIVEEIRRC